MQVHAVQLDVFSIEEESAIGVKHHVQMQQAPQMIEGGAEYEFVQRIAVSKPRADAYQIPSNLSR
jgi:hypothetical protein